MSTAEGGGLPSIVLAVSVRAGLAFTVFTVVSTQVPAVRAGSPWQDDPYNGMVSFTQILVPTLLAIGSRRLAPSRRGQPYPIFRVFQLLRFALAGFVLIGATVVVDATAVALGSDRGRWNDFTPWLAGSLIPLGVATIAGLALLRHLLPGRTVATRETSSARLSRARYRSRRPPLAGVSDAS